MPSGSAAPLVCATPDINDLNVVYVAMSADMTPSTDAQGHSIFGYATYADAVNEGYPPQTSAVVNVAMGELVQFINMEPLGSTIAHSAVGFTSSFPTVPYSFPSGSDQQVGDVLTNVAASNAVPWSTAEIEPPDDSTIDSYCASQVFQAGSTGTFYFGDYDTYNSSASMRGEIVVGAGSSTLAKHRFLTTR